MPDQNSTTSNPTTSNSNDKQPFDPSSVPKPTNWELEKPYGGTPKFTYCYGLRYWDPDDNEERKAILDGLREIVWQDRVDAARQEHEKKSG